MGDDQNPAFTPATWERYHIPFLRPLGRDAWGYIVGEEKSAQEALDKVAPAIQENLDQAWEAWEEQAT